MTETTFSKTIWAYVDTSKQVGDANHLQLSALLITDEGMLRIMSVK